MTSYSQHFLAADTSGNILYAGFQGMPCRSYLPRDAEGVPEAGANPQLLINGEEFPSFEVTYDDDLRIDPRADSEIHCTVAYEDYPHSKNPEQGFVFNSNNAPWDAAWDNNLWNDDRYIGGPWYGTWRGSRIAGLIEESDQHSVETVASIQGDHKSRMATEFLPTLLEALSTAQAYATDGELNGAAGRIAALYSDNQTAIDEAWGRLQTWQSRGLDAASGVATFYNEPSQEEQDDAVATMIFNAWFGRFVNGVFNDEGLPSVFQPTGSYGRTRALKNLIDGIGTDNPTGLASWDASTGESVFFDDAGTEDVETKDEIAVSAFVEALDYLATPFGSDRSGGFNTTDQSQWLWGLKHFVYFDNFFAREIGDDLIDALFADLGISPEHLPLDDPEPGFGDVRMGLPGFPRPGDAFAVDAAGGFTTQSYGYGSGPVMRMSLAMDPSGIHGVNVIPGGQSSHPTDPFFSDQAALWLANEASPVRFYVADVVANATGREVLSP